MFLIKSPARSAFDPILVRDPVILRAGKLSDYSVWASLREQSRGHLVQWEEDWAPHELSTTFFKRRLKLCDREMRRGTSLPLFIYRRDDDELIGGATLSNIRYGASRSAHLGYWIGAPHTRRGYGAAAVRAMLDHAFGTIGLNRVEAACQPENAASMQLLQTVGFQKEGLARGYLKINGSWRDHFIFACIAGDYHEAQDREAQGS